MGVAAVIVALVLHAQAQRVAALAARPVWPAEGTITAPFGVDGTRWHPGIDIGELRTLTVRAAQGGVVDEVGEPTGFEGYGNIVEIKVGKFDELYARLAAWNVKIGEKVRTGEDIATAGCTGFCTGTHLHFEVRYDGQAVSPLLTVLRPFVSSTPVPVDTALRDAEREIGRAHV